MPLEMEGIVNLPGYEVLKVEGANPVVIHVRYTGAVHCPSCQGTNLRRKDCFIRRLHHESLGTRKCYLWLEAPKFQCLDCGRYFHQRFPGILPYRRSTEGYRREVFEQHRDGICQTRLAERGGIGTATVERWFHDYLERKEAEMRSAACPRALGIDEHFFSRKDGYATTLCDLGRHRVYDVVLGRSEASLGGFFTRRRQARKGAGRLHGSGGTVPSLGSMLPPAGPDRGRPLPRDSLDQPALPSHVEAAGPDRGPEPRPLGPDAPTRLDSCAPSAAPAQGLLEPASGAVRDL